MHTLSPMSERPGERARPGGPLPVRRPRAVGPRRGAALLAAAALALAPLRGAAQPCPGDTAGPRLAAAPAEARIAFLRDALDAERAPARTWSWTWGLVNGALTAGQLAAAPFARGSGRTLLVAGAAASALGVFQVTFLPITPPPSPPAETERCLALGQAEEALRRGARNEAYGSGLLAQLGNLAINGGFGLAVLLTDRRWGPAALTFGLGWALGEAQILTQPTGLVAARGRYEAGALGTGPPRRAATLRLLPGPGAGLSIAAAF